MVYWFMVFVPNWLNSHVGERACYVLGLHGQTVSVEFKVPLTCIDFLIS
jgi:hypothetical protein